MASHPDPLIVAGAVQAADQNDDTDHCTNDGADVILPNNRNPSSKDSANPYAYPYFHTDFSLLYDLILQFPNTWAKTTNGATTAARNDEEGGEEDATVLQRSLVRRIELRCWTNPEELAWKDSCGDTALHRLAQMARLQHDQRSAHFLLQIAKVIVDTDNDSVLALNSWKETPLHQLMGHCGIAPHQPRQHNERNSGGTVSDKEPPIVQLTRLLCQRRAASLPNYQGNYPLHDAVMLPLVPKGLMVMAPPSARAQHAAIVDVVAAASPLAMTVSSRSGSYPWIQALGNPNACPQVLSNLLTRDILSTSVAQQETYINKISAQLQESYGPSSDPSPTFSIITSLINQGIINGERLETNVQKERLLDLLPVHTKLLWEKTKIASSRLSPRLLHSLVLARGPVPCLALAAALEPDHLLEKYDTTTVNKVGEITSETSRYPLDLVLCLPPTQGAPDSRAWDILKFFLAIQPGVAATSDMPLHIAVSHLRCNRLTWSNGIMQLFQANPQAVSIKDKSTGLYPFQLAAAAASKETDDHEATTVVFELLRADPSVVAA